VNCENEHYEECEIHKICEYCGNYENDIITEHNLKFCSLECLNKFFQETDSGKLIIKMITKEKNIENKQVGGNHYQHFKIQPLQFMMANEDMLTCCAMNVIRYICRYPHKNGKEDLLKAIDYIEKEIKAKYPD